tara:strand:- start:1472 stop:1765 length:294 start_codon:yes stop_codon:yes gene_type:complete
MFERFSVLRRFVWPFSKTRWIAVVPSRHTCNSEEPDVFSFLIRSKTFEDEASTSPAGIVSKLVSARNVPKTKSVGSAVAVDESLRDSDTLPTVTVAE